MKGSSGTWRTDITDIKSDPKSDALNPHDTKRSERLESYLEGKLRLALRLPPDNKGEKDTHHEDDAEGHDAPNGGASLHCQDTECQDQRSCRSNIMFYISFHVWLWRKCDLTQTDDLKPIYSYLSQLARYYHLPMTEAHMLTAKPDSVDGSLLSGNKRVLKLNLSSIPGRMPILGALMPSLSSTSSWVLAMWYATLGCSGWYLAQSNTHIKLIYHTYFVSFKYVGSHRGNWVIRGAYCDTSAQQSPYE